MSASQWAEACDEPLTCAIHTAQWAHPRLRPGAVVVFLLPMTASAGAEGFTALNAAAEGMRLLAKSLAKTWGGDGMRVHSVLLDAHAFLDAEHADGIAEANALHDAPLGRVPDPADDVAPLIDLLCRGDAASLVGASLVVDGGLWTPG